MKLEYSNKSRRLVVDGETLLKSGSNEEINSILNTVDYKRHFNNRYTEMSQL